VKPRIPLMDEEAAERLLFQWMDAKSLAMGPEHHVEALEEVLGGQILKKWKEVAATMARNDM
jgi:ARC6-like, IMS domain